MKLVGRFDVGGFLKQIHQLRQIEEFGESCTCAITCAFWRKFYGGLSFTEGRSPAVKMRETFPLYGVMLEIAHHRVELRHTVADRSTGGEDYTLAVGDFIDIAALEQHVGGFLCIRGRKTGDVSHFCVEEQVFERMCLIHIETVNT